jgi:hypothetical protein
VGNSGDSKGFQVTEVRSPSPVGMNPEDDPLASRILARAASGAAASSSSRHRIKSSKPIHSARWAEPEEFFLQPSERHLSTVMVTKPALLLVRAAWTGTAQGLKVAAELQGARPVTGKATRVPPNRGTVLLTTRIETRGRVEVSVRNSDRRNGTSVQLIIGTMPLSAS